jgi:hypothetical protein
VRGARRLAFATAAATSSAVRVPVFAGVNPKEAKVVLSSP